MSAAGPRGTQDPDPVISPGRAHDGSESDAEDSRCSYEKQRDKRVARMKEFMMPLVQASKNM